MKLYISGKITGTDDYMERFKKCEQKLTNEGHKVLNPAYANSFMLEGTTYEEYMKVAFCLLDMADGIYMLSGWETSQGAIRELLRAGMMGKYVYFEDDSHTCDTCRRYGRSDHNCYYCKWKPRQDMWEPKEACHGRHL